MNEYLKSQMGITYLVWPNNLTKGPLLFEIKGDRLKLEVAAVCMQ
jgi:hypothetical protein